MKFKIGDVIKTLNKHIPCGKIISTCIDSCTLERMYNVKFFDGLTGGYYEYELDFADDGVAFYREFQEKIKDRMR